MEGNYMIINHNISSINADRILKFKNKEVDQNMEKLASGMRINKAGDDASGLAVSEKMRSQIRGLNQAERNIENGVSFIQTAEGYLQETQDIIHRMRELAVQSAHGIYSDEDRMQIQVEISQLVDEVNRIASHAEFNAMKLLMGRFSRDNTTAATLLFHVGANMNQNEAVYIGTMTAARFKLVDAQNNNAPISFSSAALANQAIGTLDAAITVISKQRADLGAYQNRFETAQKGIAIASQNIQSAESIIRDTNMANATVEFTKNTILVQSGTAMLAQANVKSQSVLQLLG